jgi:hypothetical protein
MSHAETRPRQVLPGGRCEQQNWATGHRIVQSLPTPAIRAERMIPLNVPEAGVGASMREEEEE